MSLAWAIVIIIGAASLAIAAMLLVRRRAPEGSSFRGRRPCSGRLRGDRHRLLGAARPDRLPRLRELRPVQDRRRDRGSARGPAIRDRAVPTRCRPPAARRRTGLLRAVRRQQLVDARVRERRNGRYAQPLVDSAVPDSEGNQPEQLAEQSAYDKWLDRTADRENARSDRIHGAVGVIPGTLWVVLLFISAVIFVFMLFFADSGEGAATQALMMGSVIAVIAATLLLIRFLDDPFRDGIGGLSRWRWSAPCASWTLNAVRSATPAPCRATREAELSR